MNKLDQSNSVIGSLIKPPLDLFRTEDAAAYIGTASHTLEVWRCSKRYNIPYIKVGGRVRYRRSDLDIWLKSRTVGV